MKTLQIRNSTAEFLIFTKQNKEKTIEVIVAEELVWLSQKLMAELFGTTRNNITIHLSNIFEKELNENSVCKEFLHTAEDGNGRVGRIRMFKECLKNNIMPFIVLDEDKTYYMRGLKEYEHDKMFLIDTIKHEQDLYESVFRKVIRF